ncbi:hypothetical protein EUX98_g6834 [Antrodiella citrinella]|uniref:Uncharacterized protein n=1 Tax=Antrodiella citrinella TaxID=2447956 RepID=A0A4S4MVI0_9APHY|nr:hypothetical protein EUX98_g6834 [Antrodiella citrinella]
MAPVMIGSFNVAAATPAPAQTNNASGLASDKVFWFALGGALLFAGIGVCFLALALYQHYYLDALREDVEAIAGTDDPIGTVKVRRLCPRFTALLARVKAVVKLQTSKFKEVKAEVNSCDTSALTIPESNEEDDVFNIPDIIVSPPSTPSLAYDDTPSSDDDSDSGGSLTASMAEWDLSECLKEDDIQPPDDSDAIDWDEAYESDAFVVDTLLDELEARISGPLAPIMEEDESEAEDVSVTAVIAYDLSCDGSALSISDLLAQLENEDNDDNDNDNNHSSSNIAESPVTPMDDSDAPGFLVVPPLCTTKTERDAAEADSRYPRFIATSATFKRSAMQSPVKVHWKKFKRSMSLPNFVAGIALTSKTKLTSITEAAKGKSPFAKRARRDTPYVWPAEDNAEKVKRSWTSRF